VPPGWASVQTALDAGQAGGKVEFAAGAYVIGGDGLVHRTPGVALIRHHADELHGHGSFFV
jgi:hypothetical protein